MIVILFENHSYSQVIGHAAYLDALARACGLATNYWAVSHPSVPNYLALTSGATHVSSDCGPTACPQTAQNVFQEVGLAHQIWQAFDEAMPTNCALTSAGLYDSNHNPAAYYTDVRSQCLAGRNVRVGTTTSGPFLTALGGTLGSYVFITPNVCNDMHNCPVSVGDEWLSDWMPVIRQSPVYQAGHTAIVVTFDEGAIDNHVATVVVSPYVRPGTRVNRFFNHYSLLRASEFALHLKYLANATNYHYGGFGDAFHM